MTDEINVHVKVYSGRMETFINECPLYNDQVEKKITSSVIDPDVAVWPKVFSELGLVDIKASAAERV